MLPKDNDMLLIGLRRLNVRLEVDLVLHVLHTGALLNLLKVEHDSEGFPERVRLVEHDECKQ